MQKPIVSTEPFLEGGGLMGALIREKDWTRTPLGHPSTWQQSLKTCVRIVLTSQQPMFVWWGKELINIYNDAYLSIIGGKHPIALGQPASEVWKEIWNEAGARAHTVMNENVGTYDEALLLLMERNGYTEETYYTFSYSPVPGDDGTTQGIICANTDDTQRIIGARQLHTLKELAKNVVNIKSNREIYTRALDALKENPQDFPFVVLYEVSDDGKQLTLVRNLPEVLPDTLAPATIDMTEKEAELTELKLALSTGEIQHVDHIQERFGKLPSGFWKDSPDKVLLIPILQSNHEFPFAIMGVGVNPYRLLDEKYSSFYELVADQISNALTSAYAFKQEQKRAEALAEIDKAKTIFFSNISHEFRTPLTLMLGPLEEMLRSETHLSQADYENIAITHRNALRLLRLVNSLLDFSRIESGRMQAQFQPLDLAEFTTNLASSFRSVMEKAGIELEIRGKIKSAVYVDKEMWEKIVLNLLSNAFKYTHQGKISIAIKEVDGQALVSVSDTGIGIPEKEMGQLFERFHRVKNANGRSYEGTGIGLSLVRELVKLHHGTISAESREGIGSTFNVAIPIGKSHLQESQIIENTPLSEDILTTIFTEDAKSMATEKSELITTETDTDKPLVLIVDDNADMRSYIQKLLGNHYRTQIAANGKEALDRIADIQPNLIISDIMMPVMDGTEMLRILKADPLKRDIPVLLLSARAGEESKIEGFDLGADDYLVKPFSAKELLARIQSQLRISKSRSHIGTQLHNLFEQAPIAICIFRGSEFVVEMANERMLELWGKQAGEVMNKPVFTGMPDAREQGYEALLEQVFATGQTFVAKEQPLELIRNGAPEKIHVKFVFEPLREEDGTISGIMALADEITQQVEARKEIELSETRSKLAIEAAEMGNFELDIQTSKLIYSDRLAQIFGYTDVVGLSQKSFADRIHPDDRQLRADAHREAMETGVLFYEARIIWPDRSEHWARLNGKVIFDNGQPKTMYGTALDITEHKIHAQILEEKVEQRTRILKERNRELKESEERYLRMTEEVQDYVIILLDRDGTILNWNRGAEKIKGYDESEIVGKNFRVFYRKEDLKSKLPDRLLEEARNAGRATNEGFRVRKDGTFFWGSVSITALHDNQNNVIGYSKVTRDLTERKLAEDRMQKYNSELEFQNRELEQFAYVASHDLQEPLRKIQMFTGLLEQNLSDKEASEKYFSKMKLTAERMSELIKAVLNYSRLSRSDQQFERVDLNGMLAAILVDFELLIEEKGAMVTFDQLPTITAIPLQINQLFSNLLGNSLKFSETDPKIEIRSRIVPFEAIAYETSLQPGRDYLELVFADNGIGFEQKYLGKIFTIFQRLNDRTSYSGTGIGLALCKKIIENHSGFITAESERGKGASFYIYLPYQSN